MHLQKPPASVHVVRGAMPDNTSLPRARQPDLATARILTPVREADEESDDDNQQSKPKDWLPINTRVEVRDAQREENGYVGTIVGRGTSNITGLTWYHVKLDQEHPRGGTTGVYQGSQLRQANTCVLYAHALCRCF